MSRSLSEDQEKRVDAATQLARLRAWLQIKLDSLGLRRRLAARHRGSPEYLATLQECNEQEIALQEVLDFMGGLELGTEANPNKRADFLGADHLPLVHLTSEREDL